MNDFKNTHRIRQQKLNYWRLRWLLSVALLALLLSAKPLPSVSAAAGDLDPSFDQDGKVEHSTAGLNSPYREMAIQADGKLLVLGWEPDLTNTFCEHYYDFGLFRLKPDGNGDATFGSGSYGGVQTDLGGKDKAKALALQSDGKILVAGNSEICDGFTAGQVSLGLVRYTVSGSLDSTFSSDGKVLLNNTRAADLVVQPDGKLVVTGGKSSQALLTRYHDNGSLDLSFGANGEVLTDFTGDYGNAFFTLLLQADGRIVAGGTAYGVTYSWAVLARYLNDDGTPASADLSLGMISASPSHIAPGTIVTYTIPVGNIGPGKAAHVTFANPLPNDTTFVSFSAPPGWIVYERPSADYGSGKVSCSTYELPPGVTATFTLRVKVNFGVASGTQITNTSTASSLVPDPDGTNNSPSRSFIVQ
jgi:uncharacterized delta-60 repeat protein/uncharacterized repeat protein (TIGR01451 family)